MLLTITSACQPRKSSLMASRGRRRQEQCMLNYPCKSKSFLLRTVEVELLLGHMGLGVISLVTHVFSFHLGF